MLNPIEQSPALAYEPARQQALQQPQAEGAAAVTPAQAASLSTTGQVQQSAGSSSGGSATGNQSDSGDDSSSQQQSSASHRLGAAWSTLSQLKHQASAALSSVNVSAARELAAEAAGIAGSIRDLVSSAGAGATAGADSALQEADAVSAEAPAGLNSGSASSSTSAGSGGSTAGQGTSPIDLARASLGAAKDVIDTALQQPSLSESDQNALVSQQQTVTSAMVSVETVAAQQNAGSVLVTSYAAHSLVDIKA